MRQSALLLACALSFAARGALACDGLVVSDAYIPPAPAAAPSLAGYATLENRSEHALRIDDFGGRDFDMVMLHRSEVVNGVMKMRMVERLDIPAHGSVRLAPGGYHLMLMDPKRKLQPGEKTTLEFHCGKQVLAATFTVRAGP